jgi:hypothetical protein
MSLTKPLNRQSDFAFRAPLGRLVSDDEDYSPQIRPLLYRMYVACRILRLGTEARFSALVFLHRYTAAIFSANKEAVAVAVAVNKRQDKNKKKNHSMEWVAAACLFLACKGEEEPRRLRDVINLVHMILSPSVEEMKDGGCTENIVLHDNPPDLNEAYWDAKKRIVETEQEVLRWLAFDVSVSHPHRAAALLLEEEPDRDVLIEVAFRRLNDALFHGPALKHPVLELACAAIELAAEETQIDSNLLVDSFCVRYKLSNNSVALAKLDLEEATKILRHIGRAK